MKKTIIFSFVILAMLLSSVLTFAGGELTIKEVKKIRIPFRPPPPSFYYIPNQMIVKLAEESVDLKSVDNAKDTEVRQTTTLKKLNEKYGVTVFAREFPDYPEITTLNYSKELSRYYIVQFSEKYKLEEVMEAYRSAYVVEKVEPIGVHPVLESIPNDSYFLSDQWNFYDAEDNDVDATDAWDHETGDESVILGDLDTGVQYNHQDLGADSPYTDGNIWINWEEYNGSSGVDDDGNGYVDDWVGWDFVDNITGAWPGEDADTPDNEPTDFNGHGTHLAGIMSAITNNNYGVAGLAGGWNEAPDDPANGVKVMALRIGWSANYYGYEVGFVRMDFAAQAMYYAVNKGVTAINCSWGSSNTGGLGAAVDYAINNGVVVVHAAGNDGTSSADYLGSRDDVMNVCATDSDDVKADFSNYGSWVDVAAPGVYILSTYSHHYNPIFAYVSGTSQATPHVTGAAGFLKSHVPGLTGPEISDLIVDYTDNIDDLNPGYKGMLGSGRLNIFKSLDASVAPSVTVIQPNGGEVLYIGTEYEVIWDANDNVGIDSTLLDYSTDSGSTWTRIATLTGNPGSYMWTVCGPPSTTCRMKVTCYDAVGNFGSDMSDDDFCPPATFMANGKGVKSSRIVGFAVAGEWEEENTPKAHFALSQNFPNPFNPSTSISYSLAEKCHVKLTVYDVNGRVVKKLVNQTQEAGEKCVTWNASNIASGVYFYRLQTDQFVKTRKMILMR
jgi:subtilisin family serine protease